MTSGRAKCRIPLSCSVLTVVILMLGPPVATHAQIAAPDRPAETRAAGTLQGDWPQWRGPQRSGQAPDFEPPDTWPESLSLVWNREVGHSDAAPVIAGSRVFVFVREGTEEVVKALDFATGEPLWHMAYSVPHENISIVGKHGSGPFSTPLVHGDTLYTFGITEVLSAWNAETGALRWRREFAGQFKRNTPFYGNAVSPLVHDGRLFVAVGGPDDGAVLAIDPTTGEDLWRLDGDGPSYSSPSVATVSGVEHLLVMTQKRFIGVEPATGRQLWEMPYKVGFDSGSVTPLVIDDTIIVSANQRPLEAFRAQKSSDGNWSLEPVWSNAEITLEFSSPVLAGGRVVAYSTKKSGQLVVVSPKDGKILWEGPPRQGDNAFLIARGQFVMAATDDGVLRVLDLGTDPSSPVRELARYKVTGEEQGTMWNHPALASQHLVVKDWSDLRVWSLTPAPKSPP